jgi:hypothetical protein
MHELASQPGRESGPAERTLGVLGQGLAAADETDEVGLIEVAAVPSTLDEAELRGSARRQGRCQERDGGRQ